MWEINKQTNDAYVLIWQPTNIFWAPSQGSACPTHMCLWLFCVTMSPPLNCRIHPVKLTLESKCVKYLQSNRTDGTAEMSHGILWPFHHWATGKPTCGDIATAAGGKQSKFITMGNSRSVWKSLWQSLGQEIANQSQCLFSGNCSSKASVSHSCVCFRKCVNYNLGKDTTWEKNQRWRVPLGIAASSCLSGVAMQWIINSVLLLQIKQEENYQMMLWSFSLKAKWHLLTGDDSFTINTWFMTVKFDFCHKKPKSRRTSA